MQLVTAEQVVTTYFERINAECYSEVGELFAPGGTLIAPAAVRVRDDELEAYFEGALQGYVEHFDDPVRIIVSGQVVVAEIHFTGVHENGAAVEFDAVDVFDLTPDGEIYRVSTFFDTYRVHHQIRAGAAAVSERRRS